MAENNELNNGIKKGDPKDKEDKLEIIYKSIITGLIGLFTWFITHCYQEQQAKIENHLKIIDLTEHLIPDLTSDDSLKGAAAIYVLNELGDSVLARNLAKELNTAGTRHALKSLKSAFFQNAFNAVVKEQPISTYNQSQHLIDSLTGKLNELSKVNNKGPNLSEIKIDYPPTSDNTELKNIYGVINKNASSLQGQLDTTNAILRQLYYKTNGLKYDTMRVAINPIILPRHSNLDSIYTVDSLDGMRFGVKLFKFGMPQPIGYNVKDYEQHKIDRHALKVPSSFYSKEFWIRATICDSTSFGGEWAYYKDSSSMILFLNDANIQHFVEKHLNRDYYLKVRYDKSPDSQVNFQAHCGLPEQYPLVFKVINIELIEATGN